GPAYRLDGSQNRGSSGLWSQNPSVGLRWNLSNERFMDNYDWISTANLRGSWGRNIVPTGSIYDAFGRYIMETGTYNGQPIASIGTGQIPNSELESIVTTQLRSVEHTSE